MQDTILVLNLGALLGWALHRHDGTIASGSVGFPPASFEGEGMRYVRFARWLGELHVITGGLHALYFETKRNHACMDAAHLYGGFQGQVTAWCETRAVPYRGVPVGTIKKHATGMGNATSEAMATAARARGYRPSNDHEAEALALLHWVIEMRSGGA